MIKSIYFDNDETLSHSVYQEPNQKHFRFTLENGGVYYPIIRPSAKRIIDFARNLVGFENVKILTTATKDYIREINKVAEWGFLDEQLIAREEISSSLRYPTDGSSHLEASRYAHPENVLIDNLPPRENSDKISFLGIWKTYHANYFKVSDYYGFDFPDDPFEEYVMKFLEERIAVTSMCKIRGEEENLEIQPTK